jgi:hypothetical protein
MPALDVAVGPQPFHVGDQVPGGVVVERGVRGGSATTALVEQDDAVAGGIMQAAHRRVGAAARPAVHQQRHFARRVAAFLPVDLVAAGHAQPTLRTGLDRRIKPELGAVAAPVRGLGWWGAG